MHNQTTNKQFLFLGGMTDTSYNGINQICDADATFFLSPAYWQRYYGNRDIIKLENSTRHDKFNGH